MWKWRNLDGKVSLAGAKRNELKKRLEVMLADPGFYGPHLTAKIEVELALSERELDGLEASLRETAGSRALDPFWPLLDAEMAAKKTFEACWKKWVSKEPEPGYDLD